MAQKIWIEDESGLNLKRYVKFPVNTMVMLINSDVFIVSI